MQPAAVDDGVHLGAADGAGRGLAERPKAGLGLRRAGRTGHQLDAVAERLGVLVQARFGRAVAGGRQVTGAQARA